MVPGNLGVQLDIMKTRRIQPRTDGPRRLLQHLPRELRHPRHDQRPEHELRRDRSRHATVSVVWLNLVGWGQVSREARDAMSE